MADSAYERLRDRLIAVTGHSGRENGRGASMRCPAHSDRNPSLSITAIQGSVLLHCHGGCDVDAVLAALDLTRADLYDEKRGAIYRYDSGRVVHRSPDKRFRQSGDLSRVELYHLSRLRDATDGAIFLVEGEKDVHAIEALDGIATTAPMGAKNFGKVDVTPLKGRYVTAVVDRDEAGQTWADVVAGKLAGVVAGLRFVQAKTGKDAAEHVAAGHGLDEFEYIEQPLARQGRRLSLTTASTVKPARVRWGWQDRMPIGELTLIPGREGIGKSLFLAWLAAQLTRGALPGHFHGTRRAVMMAAGEDAWTYTIVPRLIAAGADLDLIYRVEVVDDDQPAARLTLPVDCALIPETAIKYDAAALMLDPIVSLVDSRLSVNQSHELRRALEPLRRAAEAAGIIVPALVHFNKTIDGDVLSKIPGGRAWAEVARAVFALARDRDSGGYVASQIKNNLGRLDLPNLTYEIVGALVDTDDGQADTGLLRWTGETDTNVEELLARPVRAGREVSDTTAAIVAYIDARGYPMSVAELAEHFPTTNRSTLQKTLRRAAERGELSNPMHGHYGPARK